MPELPKITLAQEASDHVLAYADGKRLRRWLLSSRTERHYLDAEFCGRFCYLVRNRYVLKVDRCIRSTPKFSASSHEIRLWMRLATADRKHFAPLLAWQTPTKKRRGWVLMPRLRFRPGRLPRWGWELVGGLARKYDLYDCLNYHDEELIPNNWCMVTVRGKGVPMIYDYER